MAVSPGRKGPKKKGQEKKKYYKKKNYSDEVAQQIISICWKPLSAKDIAILIGMDVRHAKDHLYGMVARGMLNVIKLKGKGGIHGYIRSIDLWRDV